MRACLALAVIVCACGRSVLGDITSDDGATSVADSSGSVEDPLTGGGDPGGESPQPDPTVQTTIDDETGRPPDPSGPDPSIDTGWLPDFASACGNGEIGAGEECDDGNYRDDDACTSSCRIPFEVSWTTTLDGSAHGFDAAHDLIIDGAGNIVVVGAIAQEGHSRDLWLQQYAPDGTTAWVFTHDGVDHRDDIGYAIAPTGDGDYIVVGSTESDATGDDIFVMRIDGGSLTTEWVDVVDGPGTGPEDYDEADDAAAVLVMPDGDIVVGGRLRIGTLDWDMWLRRYDAGGAIAWTQVIDAGAGGQDSVRAVGMAIDGTLRAHAEIEDERGELRGALLTFGDNDDFAFMDTLSGAGDMVLVPSGDTYLAMTADGDGGDGTDFAVAHFDSNLFDVWSMTLDSASDDDVAHGITTDGEMTYVVGASARNGQQENGRLFVLDDDGQPRWGDEHDQPDANLGDAFHDVAIAPDGDVVVVGFETVLGEQTNAFVRKYHPL
jgi:cysteine-rich repeat protein